MKHKKGLVILLVICAICLIAGVKGIISKASGNNSFSFNFSTSRDFDDDSDEYDEFDDDFYDDDDFDEGSDMFGRIASLKFGKDSSNAIKNIKSPYISVIYINGVISEENKTYNQKWLLDTIKKLTESKTNSGIILYISSPGGSVYESDEVYCAIKKYREKTNRPVYAY